MKLKIEEVDAVPENLQAGTIYETSDKALCMALGDGQVCRLALGKKDGEISVALLENPARPERIRGMLSGITLQKTI